MRPTLPLILTGLTCLLSVNTALSQALVETATPESAGMSTARLTTVSEDLQMRIDRGDIAGVVAAVIRDDQLIYSEALGHRNLESRAPMPFDALFRTYSMTRPITALGILMLHDDGLLDLDDPVQQYLPQFTDQPVMTDPSTTGPEPTRGRRGDITLLQLLTHTSGLGSRNSAMYRNHDVFNYEHSLAEVVDRAAALPLFEDPGTRYRYGLHAEVLGRVIEVVSGQPLLEFFQQRIFEPLGMEDTVFHVDESRRERLATVYRPDENGTLQEHRMESIPVTERRRLHSAGVGLVSSTEDFLRFSLLFLQEGEVNGEPLVSPEVIRLAGVNAIPDSLLPIDGGSSPYWAGSGWTAGGFAVALDPSVYGHAVSPGEYWWDGSAGTRFWINPEENMIAVIMAQVSPASGNGFREAFRTGIQEAIIESRAP
ncbi:MAG: serine hydrolase domain-containing protein [Pseudohongiellaceae bacterium]